MKNILVAIAFAVLGAGFAIVIVAARMGYGDAIFILVSVMIPLVIFMGISYIMHLFKKRVQTQLNATFGQNVVKIASAIMDYFQLPLTLLLSLLITLFIFTYAIIAIAWLTVFYNQ